VHYIQANAGIIFVLSCMSVFCWTCTACYCN